MRSANITAAIDGTVHPASSSALRKRIISAVILVPLALVAVVLGSPYWNLLVAVMGGLMAWEWARMCGQGRVPPAGWVGLAAVLAAIGAATIWGMLPALGLLVGGALTAAVLAGAGSGGMRAWFGFGVLYLGLPCLALLWIRAMPETGLSTLLWLLALVWATDTGAYVAGRSIGGAKLAPRVSPNKTWAGLAGGMIVAAFVGLAAAILIPGASAWPLVPVSVGLAVVEQGGDLLESAVKRRFGVKDSSNLIPGHGGVLDRVDGLLAVAVAVAALSLVSGKSLLIWH